MSPIAQRRMLPSASAVLLALAAAQLGAVGCGGENGSEGTGGTASGDSGGAPGNSGGATGNSGGAPPDTGGRMGSNSGGTTAGGTGGIGGPKSPCENPVACNPQPQCEGTDSVYSFSFEGCTCIEVRDECAEGCDELTGRCGATSMGGSNGSDRTL